jgi:hypothetical protein
MVVRESKVQGPAELADDNTSRRSLDASRPSGTGDGLVEEIADPNFDQSPAAPRLEFRRFNIHIVCQNVAGLWLKYGAKSSEVEAF